MKRLFACTLLTLGSVANALAQAPTTTDEPAPETRPLYFASASGTGVTSNSTTAPATQLNQARLLPNVIRDAGSLSDWSATATAVVATPDPATPAAPEPRFVLGGRDDFRWQLGIGFAWTRFRSSIFNASGTGVNTSLCYFTNDWFGIEGNVNSTFAPEILVGEHVKLLVYGVGPKIAWRQRKWEPWLHGLVGGIHEQPQTAGNGRNGFAAQLGGGADYRWYPRFGIRLEADYVRSSLFGQSQNNFQLAAGFVFHF